MPQTTFNKKQGIGIIGQLDDCSMLKDARSFIHGDDVALDGTSEAKFGTLVGAGVAAGQFLKLAAQADVIVGVLLHQDDYDKPNELGDVGVKESVAGSVLQRGRVRVFLEETVAVGEAVRYRAVATTGETPGAFRTTDPTGTDTVLITQGARWVEGGTAATGAVLEIDVMMLTFTSDS